MGFSRRVGILISCFIFAIPFLQDMSEIIPESFFKEENLQELKKQFDSATPYRHLAIDNFLSEAFANSLYDKFPPIDALNKHYNGLNEQKSEGSNFTNYDEVFSTLRKEVASERMSKALETITGIKGLFTTDDALGSGVHQGSNGSYLDVHIDFNIHHLRDLHRRLNLLVFLNKNWKEEYGGKVELWNENVTQLGKAYLPSFNRCVIFETSEISYHGYSRINVPEGETRKSFYTYYYTPIGDYKGKYHDTVFKARPEEGTIKKIKTDVKEGLKNNIKRTLKRLGVKF
jgi:Rps23 Pro-64 3,4-dihydroxylase Tpa1-like proline 4-hydroxylase